MAATSANTCYGSNVKQTRWPKIDTTRRPEKLNHRQTQDTRKTTRVKVKPLKASGKTRPERQSAGKSHCEWRSPRGPQGLPARNTPRRGTVELTGQPRILSTVKTPFQVKTAPSDAARPPRADRHDSRSPPGGRMGQTGPKSTRRDPRTSAE